MKHERFSITGMTCAACQANITRRVQRLAGMQAVNVSLLANQMTVDYDDTALSSDDIVRAVTEIGYGAEPIEKKTDSQKDTFRGEWQRRQDNTQLAQRGLKRRLISSVCLLIPLMYIAMGNMVGLPLPAVLSGTENSLSFALTQLFITVIVVIINNRYYTSGFKALWNRAPNMDSLIAIGSSASLIYGIFAIYRMSYGLGHGDMELVNHYGHQLYFESCAMILTLVTVGKYLEAKSKSKTSDALGKLVELAPTTTVVLRNGVEQTISAEQVIEGDTVIIRPGDRLPVDGVVLDGHGYVDQSAITGESLPVEKNAGDQVISATINKNGTFRFKASRVGSDTTLAQIIRLVDEAGSSKAPIARLADKISGVFVPTVICIAIATIIIWMLVGQSFEFALSCGIAVLVISCPCALGLATPVAIMVGTGKAAECGILIKSAESLENLHSIDTIVLDKTGTITSGHPSVTDIIPLGRKISETELLAVAASAEAGSEHPLGVAIVEEAAKRGLKLSEAKNFRAEAGRGVVADIDGHRYLGGNAAFIKENLRNADIPESVLGKISSQGKTPLIFARDDAVIGIIAVADTIRETSVQAIKDLQDMGLNVIMLTGDNSVTAEAIRKKLNIQEAISDVLPTEKESCIRRLMDEGHRTAMIGDGINDAPALMKADIGIAIGAGTDIAIEAADIVLMKDSLQDVVTAIQLSKSVIRNIRMNLFWAFFYNILGIPLAAGVLYPAFGLHLSPMIGSAAMSLSSVCVVSNALRLRRFRSRTGGSENVNIGAEAPATEKGNNIMKKTLIVDGMMCGHCQMHVQKALESVSGVLEANVDLESKKAIVTLSEDVPDSVLTSAVTDAGYSVISCAAE